MDDRSVREIVAAATRAPSVHNTQPWRFVASGQRVQLWADRTRALPVLDPDGRSLRISCGAAIAMAQTYARARGIDCHAVLLPDAAQPDLLADLVLSDGAGGAPDTEQVLAAAIGERHTDRRPFAGTPVPAEAVRALAHAAQEQGCWLRVVSGDEDVAAVAVALARADEILTADPAYQDELRQWTSRSAHDTDGVPVDAAAAPPPAQRASPYRLRDFGTAPEEVGRRLPPEAPPTAEHPLVVVLGTADDDARAWLTAGLGLGRVLLTATARGLAASPMTQALEVPGTRHRLTSALGLVGHPQVVLRVGFPLPGDAPAPPRRRPLDEVLTAD